MWPLPEASDRDQLSGQLSEHSGAASLDDESGRIDHCAIQLTLARTEMSLGNHDEALLCLFEVERIGCGHDPETVEAAESLRREIERRMADSARQFIPDYDLLAGLPELVDDPYAEERLLWEDIPFDGIVPAFP